MLVEIESNEVSGVRRAMASDVTIRARAGGDRGLVERAVAAALGIFSAMEAACTRFDPTSPLMRANATPSRWHEVPQMCFDALEEADRAYKSTKGRFDPRVLTDLVKLGYDRSFPLASGEVGLSAGILVRRRPLPPWRPRFRGAPREVLLGTQPVDLGGIGKGLAVRWASEQLYKAAPSHLIDAGGDCRCSGTAPDGEPWRIAVEDPLGGPDPVAVLELTDRSCATSSIRLRRWKAGEREAHHLIDPKHGAPGGNGLAAVTVVGLDPAKAEVWSKVLFLEGRTTVCHLARRKGLAALWVDTQGNIATSPAMLRYLRWVKAR